jgi:hypothetical protein
VVGPINTPHGKKTQGKNPGGGAHISAIPLLQIETTLNKGVRPCGPNYFVFSLDVLENFR